LSTIDFEDFYRICSDSNMEGAQEEIIMILRKPKQDTESNTSPKAPRLENLDQSQVSNRPIENRNQIVVHLN
jgi:hypothetical protein